MKLSPSMVHLALIVGVALSPAAEGMSAAESTAALTTEQWREDIDFLVAQTKKMHPDPFYRISEVEFERLATRLKDRLQQVDPDQVVVGILELTAALRDGHTALSPTGPHGLSGWFPIRLQRFGDRLIVSVAPRSHPELAGGNVLKIGAIPAIQAFDRVSVVTPADNRLGKRIDTPMYLVSPRILTAMGIIPGPEKLPLTVRTRSGEVLTVTLKAIGGEFNYDWYWNSFDLPGKTPGVLPFPRTAAELPLYLRHTAVDPRNYWFTDLGTDRAVYFQFNAVLDSRNETFEAFSKRLLTHLEDRRDQIDKLIVDLRFNPGGNGYMLAPFIEALAAMDWLNQKGRILVLTGPRTFSAGVVVAGMLKKQTAALIVGEPAAAHFNFFSDMKKAVLPNSGFRYWVASLYWEHGTPGDRGDTIVVDLPVETTADQFLRGDDPVLKAALRYSPPTPGD